MSSDRPGDEGTGHARIVAIGGGHGLAATLAALRDHEAHLTAVVAVADDGGSTGRLRDAVDLPALGDLRKAIVALAAPDSRLASAMPHRFGAGDIVGHAFGNLLIAALAESGDGLLGALDEITDLVGATGRVLPATTEPVVLHATTRHGREVIGQVRIMRTADIERVSLVPTRPAAPSDAVDAIVRADRIVLGPGSLFTSVLAATAVPAIREAVAASPAQLVYVCNLQPQVGETEGYGVAEHLEAIQRHGLQPDVVLYDPEQIGEADGVDGAVPRQLATANGLAHDPKLLAAALATL
jgi:uncharacterized cofD-like protein